MIRSTLTRTVKATMAGAIALSLSACGINSVPTAEENAKAKWGDVEAQFQRRANLIPNLAEIAKGAAENEKEILTQVTGSAGKGNQRAGFDRRFG